MSAMLYKVLHIFGVLLTFTALGAVTFQALTGRAAAGRAASGAGDGSPGRKLAGLTHGIALLVILISGFGMLAKLGYGFPLWVWIKIVVWLLLGAAAALVRRLPQHATIFWFAIPVLGAFAAYLAIYKPF